MLRVAIALGLFLLPASAFSRDYCEGSFCYQKKARVSCLKPGVWDMLNKVVARVGRLEITSACDGKHARHSYHYTGQAVDFRPMQTSAQAVLAVLRSMPEVGGIGTYGNGLLHADIRSQRIAWHHSHKSRVRYAGMRRGMARYAQVRQQVARYAQARQTVARYALARQPMTYAPRLAFRRVAAVR
jgi:hypothetical protein